MTRAVELLLHISGSPAVVPQLLLLLHLIQPRQHTNSLQRDES